MSEAIKVVGRPCARTHTSKGSPVVIPAKSRIGRVRRAALRAFIAADGGTVMVSDVLRRAYPRSRRFTSWQYHGARLALRKVAVVVARRRFGRGRPAVWAKLTDG